MKTLNDVVAGDLVFRWLGGIAEPMQLKVAAVTYDRIICVGGWEFDKKTGAEIDAFLGWGTTRTGSYIRATRIRPEFN